MGTQGLYNELEFMILALVGEGVTSGYSIRKEMNRMRGGRWSSESGSVYRVLRRLEGDGLIVMVRQAGVPNRLRSEYELTAVGEGLLARWLTYPPQPSEMGFLVDPIRTRGYFLTRLKPAEQLRVVKVWIVENKRLLDELERDADKSVVLSAHPLRAAAYQNYVLLARARHEWLKWLRGQIKATAAARPCEAEPATGRSTRSGTA